MTKPSPFSVVLAILLSGTLLYLSAGIIHFWIAAWLAPIPLLVVLLDLPIGWATAAAFTAMAIGASSLVFAFYDKFPPLILVLIMPMFAIPFTLVALAWRAIARRVDPRIAVIAYPALVASSEYLTSLVSPNGMLGSLANSQGDVLLVLQLAAFTGSWGISFLLSLAAATLAMAWRQRATRRQLFDILLIGAVPLVLALFLGAMRLAQTEPAGQVSVGLAATDDGAGRTFAMRNEDAALPVVKRHARLAQSLAEQGAKYIVLPEKFVGITPEYAGKAIEVLAAVAREKEVTIVAGFNFYAEDERRNVAMVIGPQGQVVLEYDKRHMVPGFEDSYRVGDGIGVIPATSPAIGVAICKDLDFVNLGREYSRAGVGLLLVPAWDFEVDGWAHSRMAIVRGVEGGFAIARSAIEGRLTMTDSKGRVVAERSTKGGLEVQVVKTIAIDPGGTFYSRFGDWFAWLCLGGVFACALAAWKSPILRSQ